MILDIQNICLSYLNILKYEKSDIITSFACSNVQHSYNKKVYDIWYKKSRHIFRYDIYW
jgi:hypothetical protein